MNRKIWEGVSMLKKYLLESNDYSCFPALHSKIDILHLQRLHENCFDKGYKIDTVAKWLSQSIAQCLDFYTLWSEKNPNSFIEYLDESFVHNLLELYEDDGFFMLLTSISKVRNEKALSLLSYYADDEEIHISTKIRELINTMR